ncbi:hypothetical protein TSOC_000868 [Tetrabaena socialis]|uniref:Uncharacterized protein n=1 Tax=Tetrabaena socialis TaxID=47790 RepID=A0A2J8AIC9_9CHLO|nr:hypothetical protein TSOC_000868 [Tetrabaena socialis]|eukprot:PNH12267.1 hypothetical protein TSOC_000868 [Tetrabaena socialis]
MTGRFAACTDALAPITSAESHVGPQSVEQKERSPAGVEGPEEGSCGGSSGERTIRYSGFCGAAAVAVAVAAAAPRMLRASAIRRQRLIVLICTALLLLLLLPAEGPSLHGPRADLHLTQCGAEVCPPQLLKRSL